MLLHDIITALQEMEDKIEGEHIPKTDVEVTDIILWKSKKGKLDIVLDIPDGVINSMTLYDGKLFYIVTKPKKHEETIINKLSDSYINDIQ